MADETRAMMRAADRTVRLGVVSFINTLPLIDGLEHACDLDLRFTVPSRLIDLLQADEVDVALCSSIDYLQSTDPMVVLPVGLLGCDGPTLTVRLYAQRPIDAIDQVHCDTDSHTSVVLMRILLRELHGLEPTLIPYDAREHVAGNRLVDHPEAMLLIGDKVVTDSPPAVRYPYQLDLGEAWKRLTGRPFVFATWMAKRDTDPAVLHTAARLLDRQRRANRMRLDTIIHHRALPRNWPRDLASEYLRQRIQYEFLPEHVDAMELYFRKAVEIDAAGEFRSVSLFTPDAAACPA